MTNFSNVFSIRPRSDERLFEGLTPESIKATVAMLLTRKIGFDPTGQDGQSVWAYNLDGSEDVEGAIDSWLDKVEKLGTITFPIEGKGDVQVDPDDVIRITEAVFDAEAITHGYGAGNSRWAADLYLAAIDQKVNGLGLLHTPLTAEIPVRLFESDSELREAIARSNAASKDKGIRKVQDWQKAAVIDAFYHLEGAWGSKERGFEQMIMHSCGLSRGIAQKVAATARLGSRYHGMGGFELVELLLDNKVSMAQVDKETVRKLAQKPHSIDNGEEFWQFLLNPNTVAKKKRAKAMPATEIEAFTEAGKPGSRSAFVNKVLDCVTKDKNFAALSDVTGDLGRCAAIDIAAKGDYARNEDGSPMTRKDAEALRAQLKDCLAKLQAAVA
jgi:hypothetical protein